MDDDINFDSTDIINNYGDDVDVGESKLATRTTQIQQLVSHFEMRLLGYMWTANAEKYHYTGKTLIGDDSLQKIMLLLHPFSREVILISDKKDFNWHKQVLRTRINLINLLTKAIDVNIDDAKEIWRSFSNLMFNIGDIILNKNSLKFMQSFFGMDKQEDIKIPTGDIT